MTVIERLRSGRAIEPNPVRMEPGEALMIHQAMVAMPTGGYSANLVSDGRRAAAPDRHRPLSRRDLEGGTREQPG